MDMAKFEITETSFLVKYEDGTSILRGIRFEDPYLFGEKDLIRVAPVTFAREGTTVAETRILGTITGTPDTKVNDVDYDGDGVKVQVRKRTLAQDTRFAGVICGCGKEAYCPQFGTGN